MCGKGAFHGDKCAACVHCHGGRWGTYAVQQPLPMTTDDEAAEYLRALLPELRRRWLAWKDPSEST